MAELDAASIFLIILAVLIAPWVLPRLLHGFGRAADEAEEHKELIDRIGR